MLGTLLIDRTKMIFAMTADCFYCKLFAQGFEIKSMQRTLTWYASGCSTIPLWFWGTKQGVWTLHDIIIIALINSCVSDSICDLFVQNLSIFGVFWCWARWKLTGQKCYLQWLPTFLFDCEYLVKGLKSKVSKTHLLGMQVGAVPFHCDSEVQSRVFEPSMT